jgi:hypothetical protein
VTQLKNTYIFGQREYVFVKQGLCQVSSTTDQFVYMHEYVVIITCLSLVYCMSFIEVSEGFV